MTCKNTLTILKDVCRGKNFVIANGPNSGICDNWFKIELMQWVSIETWFLCIFMSPNRWTFLPRREHEQIVKDNGHWEHSDHIRTSPVANKYKTLKPISINQAFYYWNGWTDIIVEYTQSKWHRNSVIPLPPNNCVTNYQETLPMNYAAKLNMEPPESLMWNQLLFSLISNPRNSVFKEIVTIAFGAAYWYTCKIWQSLFKYHFFGFKEVHVWCHL